MRLFDKPIDAEDQALARAWLAVAREPRVVVAIDTVHAEIARRIEARAPACWASGRCCNLKNAGHLLFVTGLEAASVVVRIEERAIDSRGRAVRVEARSDSDARVVPLVQAGVRERSESDIGEHELNAANQRGDCPYLEGNACGVHWARPMGCRVYFCDRTAKDWHEELAQWAHAEIRAIHDREGITYRYAEWRWMLGLVIGQKSTTRNST